MTEPDVANDKELADETIKNGKKSKEEKSKKGAAKKKPPVETESDEEEEEAEVIPEVKTKRGAQKASKDAAESGKKKEKVPLLDQPAIVEGSRNRRTVVQYETQVTVTKFSPIDIPKGKGTPLGRIPNINGRMKRLRQNVLKELHRFLFGKCGNPDNFIVNLQKFCGFPFEIESDPYNRKLSLLAKFPVDNMKELLHFLDLDLKFKKKDEAVKRVLNFLVRPDIMNTEQTTQPTGHPKRKATKRNYEDAEIDETELKKKKKQAAVKSSAEEVESGKPEENGKVESRRKTKNSSESETNATDDDAQKDNESDEENDNNEMKKPAKKRKRNQVIDEAKENAKESKNQKKKSTGKQKKKKTTKEEEEEEVADKSESEASGEEEEKKKTDLTDEELKSFLQSVLANANLEETTMKTVYGLINTHYPEYNFSKKKDFIKDIVKSLLQSS